MGLLWLSIVPLTNGLVAEFFGVKNMSMLGGIAFFSHQIGSFVGGWLGGRLYDAFGSYNIAWGHRHQTECDGGGAERAHSSAGDRAGKTRRCECVNLA